MIRLVSRGLLLATMLTSATTAFADDEGSKDTSVIVVTGERERTISSAGTKSAMPIAEIPQSISVVNSEQIARLGLQNLSQALRFVPGVTGELRGSSAEVYDLFTLRGFDAYQYLDGLRVFSSPTGYAQAQVDMSRLERVEVVKGPASALYGASGPGGLVAMTSKLPLDKDLYGAVSASLGNYDLYRLDADMGGKVGENIGYRLYASANGAHTQQTWGKRERQTVSGAVTLGLGGPTSLTLLGNYSHDPYNGTYGGFPAVGTLYDNPNGQVSTHFDAGEKDNRIKRNQAAGTFIFTHDFGSGWNFRSSGRYQYVSSNFALVYSSGTLDDTQTQLSRGSYVADESMKSWTFDNQLNGTVQTGPVEHHVMFGFDSQVLHSREEAGFGTADSIDIYNPVYGLTAVPKTVDEVVGGVPSSYPYNNRQRGLYVQDEMALGGLRVTLSGRQDWTRVHPIGSDAIEKNKFTYRIGGLYKLPFGLAPYVSYSTSFQPQGNTVVDENGNINGYADPSVGKQLEIGAKYQVPGTQVLVTGAWFDIKQSNVLVYVANLGGYQLNGSQRSRGVEVEATAPLPHGFQAKVAFNRQSVRDQDGARVVMAGRGGITGDLEWAPKDGALQGFALGGTLRHVGPVATGVVGLNTPSYTLVDALARLDVGTLFPRLGGMTLSVNAQNLFDKKYLTGCYAAYSWCWYGNRRTVVATIGYHF